MLARLGKLQLRPEEAFNIDRRTGKGCSPTYSPQRDEMKEPGVTFAKAAAVHAVRRRLQVSAGEQAQSAVSRAVRQVASSKKRQHSGEPKARKAGRRQYEPGDDGW
jgi:hypothetical protein